MNALRRYQVAAGVASGPLFRQINKGGRSETGSAPVAYAP